MKGVKKKRQNDWLLDVQELANAVVTEAIEKSRGNPFSGDWNLDAHVEITLTIRDIRRAARIAKIPTKPI